MCDRHMLRLDYGLFRVPKTVSVRGKRGQHANFKCQLLDARNGNSPALTPVVLLYFVAPSILRQIPGWKLPVRGVIWIAVSRFSQRRDP